MAHRMCMDIDSFPSTSTATRKIPNLLPHHIKIGILKKGLSTPNLSAQFVEVDETEPTTPKGATPLLPRQVKFTYVSPSDKWRTQKKLARSKSTERMETPSKEIEIVGPELEAGRGRATYKKPRSGVTDRSLSRTRRLQARPETGDQVDDLTKVFGFLANNVFIPTFKRRFAMDLLELSILQYFQIIHDISDTFDNTLFYEFNVSGGIHAQILQYTKLTLEAARKLEIKIKINRDILRAPMTQRTNCSTTKKKLAFLRALVDRAEAEIQRRKAYDEDEGTNRNAEGQHPILAGV